MTLGAALDQALPGLRAEAESLMNCQCAITDPTPDAGGEQTGDQPATFDPETGLSTQPDAAAVYSGPCRVRKPTLTEQAANSGEFQWTLQDSVLSVPISATGADVGHRVQITASAQDPDLIDRTYEVVAVLRGSQTTARRLIIREA